MSVRLPEHIAIVMDGNGRWAESRGMIRIEGHKAGVSAVKTIIRCCLEKKIPNLSLFAFSSENWSRPAQEVNFLMELFIESLGREIQELHTNGIRLFFTGERTDLSAGLQAEMQKAEQLTENNRALNLNIVVNYGGKWDILQAVKKTVQAVQQGKLSVQELDEAMFASYLSTAHLPDPDLLIRTSGELRISNFLLWQLAYAELYFTEINWPDFNEQEFNKALQAFSLRKRRFGLTNEQLQGQDYA